MNYELLTINCLNKECEHEFVTNSSEFTNCPSCGGEVLCNLIQNDENDCDDVFAIDKEFSKDAEFATSKKHNMHYWDEIEGVVENSFIDIAKYAGVSIEELSDYDDIKAITEMYISLIEKRFNVKFPIVND